MTDKPSAVNAEGIAEPFAVESVPWQGWSEGSRYGSRFRHLSAFGGASHVGVAMEELAPGMESSLNHYHMLEEEQALIVAGEMTLKLGDKTYLVKAGDYVCFSRGPEGRTFLLQPQQRALPLPHHR